LVEEEFSVFVLERLVPKDSTTLACPVSDEKWKRTLATNPEFVEAAIHYALVPL